MGLQHVVYLNNFQDAIELFEKRSRLYNDRIVPEMAKL
jgi:hypothetical protein